MPWRSQLVLQRSQGVDQWVVGLTTRKPGVKRNFVDLKIAPKKETGGNLEAGFEFLKVCGEVTSREKDRFSLLLFGFD